MGLQDLITGIVQFKTTSLPSSLSCAGTYSLQRVPDSAGSKHRLVGTTSFKITGQELFRVVHPPTTLASRKRCRLHRSLSASFHPYGRTSSQTATQTSSLQQNKRKWYFHALPAHCGMPYRYRMKTSNYLVTLINLIGERRTS